MQSHRSKGWLSTRQIRAVENAIQFVTPKIYEAPDDPQTAAREAELKGDLACQLDRDQAARAFSFTEHRGENSSRGFIGSWFDWFSDCVVR